MREGSYSVEAALIMPGIVLLTLLFLLFGFYIRDVIVTEAYGRSLLLDWETNIGREQSEMRDQLQEALWCSEAVLFSIYEHKDNVRVSYKIVPNIGFIKLLADNIITIPKTEVTTEKIQKWYVWIDEAKELFLTED